MTLENVSLAIAKVIMPHEGITTLLPPKNDQSSDIEFLCYEHICECL